MFTSIGSAVPKKKNDAKIAQLYMKGDQVAKKTKYETTIRQEKAMSAHIARTRARRDVSAPKKIPEMRSRVGAKPLRKNEKS